MKKDNSVYLDDILNAIHKIANYTEGISFQEFESNPMRSDATIRQLEIVGEAVRKLSPDFLHQYPDFPVKQAIEMRNFLIHGYDNVELEVVWKTVQEDLPAMQEQLTRILA